jgi:hypothetical protein
MALAVPAVAVAVADILMRPGVTVVDLVDLEL